MTDWDGEAEGLISHPDSKCCELEGVKVERSEGGARAHRFPGNDAPSPPPRKEGRSPPQRGPMTDHAAFRATTMQEEL